MPGFKAILSNEQAGALAAYLRKYGAGQPAWPELDEQVSKARAP